MRLRTPSTFAAADQCAIILVTTASAPVYRRGQTELLGAWLTSAGVAFEELGVPDEPLTATLRRMSHTLGAGVDENLQRAMPASAEAAPVG